MSNTVVVTERRVKRAKQTAEVFTPDNLVNDMLSKLPRESWKKDKTFCDPACGNGQFLVHILNRKLRLGHDPLRALQSIYGVDIMRDNIRECRQRLLLVIQQSGETILEDHVKAVFQNIRFLSKTKYPKGALDYDFSFTNKIKLDDVRKWMEEINSSEDWLENISLPVTETEFHGKQLQSLFDEESPEPHL